MKLYTLPAEIEGDYTKRVYIRKDMHGNSLCHFERQLHTDDLRCSIDTDSVSPCQYHGQWVG